MPAAANADIARFFFRTEGRIGRSEYLLGIGLILAVDAAVLLFLIARTDFDPGVLVLFAITGIPLTVAMLVLVAKRCHDIGLPGSFVLLLVVPPVGAFWLIALAIIPGNGRPNLYGAPPQFRPD
jgi:uncharacterized membrane protein YhaH (DUF805 family)